MTGKDNAHFSDATSSTSISNDSGRSYRRSTRTHAHRPIAIYPRLRGGRAAQTVARLRDYSASGLGLVTGQSVEIGTRFAVRLVNADGSKVALVFEVVYCQPDDNGTFQIGARLPECRTQASPRRDEYQASIMGKTVSNWDRVLDIRAEPDRLWLNMHPPHSESGWGMYVDRNEIESLMIGDDTVAEKRAA